MLKKPQFNLLFLSLIIEIISLFSSIILQVNPILAQENKQENSQKFAQDFIDFLDSQYPLIIEPVLAETSQSEQNLFDQAVELSKLADTEVETENYPQALTYFEEALTIFQQLNHKNNVAVILHKIGLVYEKQSEYEKALIYFKNSLNIVQKLENFNLEKANLTKLGDIYIELENYQIALDYHRQALIISSIIERNNNLYSISNILTRFGYDKRPEILSAKLLITNNWQERAKLWLQFSDFYLSLGQPLEAVKYAQLTLNTAQSINDKKLQTFALNQMGDIYHYISEYILAIEYYNQALKISQEINDQYIEATILHNLGLIAINENRFQESLNFQEQSLALFNTLNYDYGKSKVYHTLGESYQKQQQYQKALNYYNQALAIRENNSDYSGIGNTVNNLGNIYQELNQQQDALSFYQQSANIFDQILSYYNLSFTFYNLGTIYYQLGDYSTAEKYLTDAIKLWEFQRLGLVETDKLSLEKSRKQNYSFLQKILVSQNQQNLALEIAERARNSDFNELQLSNTDENNPLNIQQIQEIAKQQNATLVEYSVISEKEVYIWVIKPTGEINFKSKIFQNNEDNIISLIANSRQKLNVDSLTSTRSYSLETVMNANDLDQLHQILIQPIAEFLPTDPNQKVIFIPHQELFLVPFPALKDDNGTYLIEKHTILTAPSIHTLQLTYNLKENRPNNQGEKLIIGNPTMPNLPFSDQKLSSLPYAEIEAKNISILLETQAILGDQATETLIVEKMPQAKIIHLATHGLLSYQTIDQETKINNLSEDKWFLEMNLLFQEMNNKYDNFLQLYSPGAIALAPSNNDDGYLTAFELFKMKLQADLVVLSACQTGKGRITGDGVIGLSRSLISAGVPSVLVSLWSVDDKSTSELMIEFYQNLQNGMDKAQALRQAMLTVKITYPQPKYWAAFTLIGES